MTLALKYRPRSIEDIAGQNHVTVVLSTMLKRWEKGEYNPPASLLYVGP